jgi:hypothetical protein
MELIEQYCVDFINKLKAINVKESEVKIDIIPIKETTKQETVNCSFQLTGKSIKSTPFMKISTNSGIHYSYRVTL